VADKKIDDNEVTTAAVKNADQTSNPVPNDAEANDPPVRTNRPDVPIAASLAAGAGAHEVNDFTERKGFDGDPVEVDQNGVNRDGRVVAAAK
jgi:hypothetical protein